MKCFEVTLIGFNGDTDDTDDLVKWVNAPSLSVLQQVLETKGLTRIVDTINEMDLGELGPSDGVDVIIETIGITTTITHGMSEIDTWPVLVGEK